MTYRTQVYSSFPCGKEASMMTTAVKRRASANGRGALAQGMDVHS